jgi:hypothetical protein
MFFETPLIFTPSSFNWQFYGTLILVLYKILFWFSRLVHIPTNLN